MVSEGHQSIAKRLMRIGSRARRQVGITSKLIFKPEQSEIFSASPPLFFELQSAGLLASSMNTFKMRI